MVNQDFGVQFGQWDQSKEIQSKNTQTMTYPRKLVANRHKIGDRVRVWSAKESQPLRPIEIKRERERVLNQMIDDECYLGLH